MHHYPAKVFKLGVDIRLLLLDVDGVLTDGTIYLDNHGVEAKGFNIMDGLGMNLLKRAGVGVGIITGRKSEVVAARAKELNLTHLVQGCHDKLSAAREIAEADGITLAQVAYVGDDLIDLALLRQVGLSFSVPNGAVEVREAVHHVTHLPGGRGAVREVCELILKAKNQWSDMVDGYR